jgi:hypothetical protein
LNVNLIIELNLVQLKFNFNSSESNFNLIQSACNVIQYYHLNAT